MSGNDSASSTRPVPDTVVQYCLEEGLGWPDIRSRIASGEISDTYRLATTSGRTLVLKRSLLAPADLYLLESRGLDSLSALGAVRAPAVHLVDPEFLLLEDLGSTPPADDFWERYGRALAEQHAHHGPAFGWAYDNYLGLLVQRNTVTGDGHEFFAEQRVLRFLETPRCDDAFSPDDRVAIGRFAARLRDLIPVQPPSLLHGDLWSANMLAAPGNAPAAVDPAVHYGWPEAELAMVRQCGGVPREFFDAYQEVAKLADGWWQRLEILFIRELLSAVAHLGNARGSADAVRALVAKYR